MKIAIIDPVGLKAGMNCYDIGLLNGLLQKGNTVYSFSNFEDKNYKDIKQFSYFLKKKSNLIENIFNFVIAHFRAIWILKKEKVGVTVLHVFSTSYTDYFSFFIIRLFRIKIIAIVHDINSLCVADKNFIREYIYNSAAFLVVHNHTSENEIKPLLNDQNKGKLHVIPHGNYIEFIPVVTPTSLLQKEIHFDKNYKYLLFFGQIKRVKGLDILIKSLPYLKGKFKLIIAGLPHRDNFEYYNQLIDDLKVSDMVVKIIRFISDDERDYLFKNADALMLPYRKIYQSGVMLLSMSYGLPVVASDLSANKEIIDNSNGVLFEDGNHEDLGRKTEELFSDGNISEKKINAFNTANTDFSWSGIATKYLDMLEPKIISKNA